MKQQNDCRDWLIMGIVTSAWVASTVFLFKHPDVANFVTWAGLASVMTGVYHWLTLLDSKREDRCGTEDGSASGERS